MGAGLAPAVPSRGTCLLPHRSMLCLNLVHPCRLCAVCVTVLVGVCTVPSHCSVVHRSRSERLGGEPRVVQQWLFSCILVLPQRPSGCGILGSVGIFCVCMFFRVVCSLLPWSNACSLACMDFSGSVLCAECHPVSCDHPCSY